MILPDSRSERQGASAWRRGLGSRGRSPSRALAQSGWLAASMLVAGTVAPAQDALRNSLAGDAAAGGRGNGLYGKAG
jgi:hypothetical protein